MFLMLAGNGFLLNASIDEETDIEQALDDLDEGESLSKNPNYWERIRETLLNLSASKNVDQAILEWKRQGAVMQVPNGVCKLCGHTPILFHFPLKNKVNGNELIVGSECIIHYKALGSQFTDLAQLKKQLKTQLNAIRKTKGDEKGQVEALGDIEEIYKLEKELRERLGSIIGPQDLDVNEYRTSLIHAQSIGRVLNIKNSDGFSLGGKALDAVRALFAFQEDIRKRQKTYKGNGLYSLIETIKRQKKDYGEQVGLLNQVRKMTSAVFAFGKPNEVIDRMWDAIEHARDGLVANLQQKADQAKSGMLDSYKKELELLKPYSHLSFVLHAALATNRKLIDAQVSKVADTVNAEGFFDEVVTNRDLPSRLVNQTFSTSLAGTNASTIEAGSQLAMFADAIMKGFIGNAVKAISEFYKVAVRDIPGVQASILRAADDGIIDADVHGAAAISKFVMFFPHNAKIQTIVREEVDEVASLSHGGAIKVYEQMSADLGIDVEKVFKLYASDNNFERSFITTIFNAWKGGRKLSPAQQGNIRKQLASKKVKEVPHSMWAALHSELIAPYTGRKL